MIDILVCLLGYFLLLLFLKKTLILKNKRNHFFFSIFFITIIYATIKFANNIYFFIDLFFLFTILCFVCWFYYTFVKGFSSQIIILIKKYNKEEKIINFFLTKDKKNKIISERIKYLKKGYFIKLKKKIISLNKKTKIIAAIHNFFSLLLFIKKSGGISND